MKRLLCPPPPVPSSAPLSPPPPLSRPCSRRHSNSGDEEKELDRTESDDVESGAYIGEHSGERSRERSRDSFSSRVLQPRDYSTELLPPGVGAVLVSAASAPGKMVPDRSGTYGRSGRGAECHRGLGSRNLSHVKALFSRPLTY